MKKLFTLLLLGLVFHACENGGPEPTPVATDLQIEFTQPGTFNPGDVRLVDYTLPKTQPSSITATEVPAGWTVVVRESERKIEISCNVDESKVINGTAKIVLTGSDGATASKDLRLLCHLSAGATLWQGGVAPPAAYVTTNTSMNVRIKPGIGGIIPNDQYGSGATLTGCTLSISNFNSGEQITRMGVCWAKDVGRPDLGAYKYAEYTLGSPISRAGNYNFIGSGFATDFVIPGVSYSYCLYAKTNNGDIFYSNPMQYTLPAKTPTGTVQKYPVVFHVLCGTPEQNVRKEYIDAFLAYANLALRNQMTPTIPIPYDWSNQGGGGYAIPAGADTHIELVMAETDPEGLLMPVPGVDRRPWNQTATDAEAFLKAGANGDQMALLWDPYTYINVWLFDFAGESSTAGMALLPIVPNNHKLDGLMASNSFIGMARPTDRKPGVCINTNDFTLDYAQSFGHELGHYFGLRHAFSTSICGDGNDYCADTPDYVLNVDTFSGYFDEPRTGCDGSKFISYNIMDYYGLGLQFSADQVSRTSHVQQYGYFIPGSEMATRTRAGLPEGDMTPPPPEVIRLPLARRMPTIVSAQQVD